MKRWNEDRHQQALAEYLDLQGLPWFHVPNGGKRLGRTGAILRSMGVKRGVPDVIIIHPYRDAGGMLRPGLAVELKVPAEPGRRKGQLSCDQLVWQRTFEREGWGHYVAYGWASAAAHVAECYGLRLPRELRNNDD